jgi:hypothetical protein
MEKTKMTKTERATIEVARINRTTEEWKKLPVVTCVCGQRFYREHELQEDCRDCMSSAIGTEVKLPINFYHKGE